MLELLLASASASTTSHAQQPVPIRGRPVPVQVPVQVLPSSTAVGLFPPGASTSQSVSKPSAYDKLRRRPRLPQGAAAQASLSRPATDYESAQLATLAPAPAACSRTDGEPPSSCPAWDHHHHQHDPTPAFGGTSSSGGGAASAASKRATMMLRPFQTGHERVVEHHAEAGHGHLEVLPPTRPHAKRPDAMAIARRYTHPGVAPWDQSMQPMPPAVLYSGVELPKAGQDGFDATVAIVKALNDFNSRHTRNADGAVHLLGRMDVDEGPPSLQTSPRLTREYGFALDAVRRNRFWVEKPSPSDAPKLSKKAARRRQVRRWDIDTSIWAPRRSRLVLGASASASAEVAASQRQWSDYFESAECLQPMFERDWFLAINGHGLSKLIQQHDETGHIWLDDDGNGTHDSVDHTKDALWDAADVVYGAFDYYSALLSDRMVDKESGEYEVWSIQFNRSLLLLRLIS